MAPKATIGIRPSHILHDKGKPCAIWFDDALADYGVLTVLADLYLLVPHIQMAAEKLMKDGWMSTPRPFNVVKCHH